MSNPPLARPDSQGRQRFQWGPQIWHIHYGNPAISLLSRPTIFFSGRPRFSYDHMDLLKDLAGNCLGYSLSNTGSTAGCSYISWSYDIVCHSWAGGRWSWTTLFPTHDSGNLSVCTGWGLPIRAPEELSSLRRNSSRSFQRVREVGVTAGWKDPLGYRYGLEKCLRVHGCTLSR